MYTEPGESWQDYFQSKDLRKGDLYIGLTSSTGPILPQFPEHDSTSFFESLLDPSASDCLSLGSIPNSDLYDPPPPVETVAPSELNSKTNPPQLSIARPNEKKSIIPQYPFSQSLPNTERAGAVQFFPSGSGILQPLDDLGSPMTLSQASPMPGSSEPRRDAHMASEQRRRAVMRESFERLQQLLPASEYRKPSKANLLQAAVSYITRLRDKERFLLAKINFLIQENGIISQQLHGTPSPIAMTQRPRSDGNTPIAPATAVHHQHPTN